MQGDKREIPAGANFVPGLQGAQPVEDKSERQQTEELSRRVADLVTGEQVFEHVKRVQEALMQDIRKSVLRGATESLLMYRGLVARQRDAEWSRVMSAIWLPDGLEEAQVPTDPWQLQAVILGWQGRRERELAIEKYREGVQQTFTNAYVAGARFGWGASSMGKPLDDVVAVAEKQKPSL
jgi:hypothetical protein